MYKMSVNIGKCR